MIENSKINGAVQNNYEYACGIKPFQTTEVDPFHSACVWHDLAYVEGSDQQLTSSRAEVDSEFLLKMLDLASGSRIERIRAYLYYGIARLLGAFFWEGES